MIDTEELNPWFYGEASASGDIRTFHTTSSYHSRHVARKFCTDILPVSCWIERHMKGMERLLEFPRIKVKEVVGIFAWTTDKQ